ncbi:MAG: hypothetical protein ACSLEN_01130 [Candidatus Malihini olakiniferum]
MAGEWQWGMWKIRCCWGLIIVVSIHKAAMVISTVLVPSICLPRYMAIVVLLLNDLSSHRTERHQIGYYVQNQFRYDDCWIALIGGR